MKREVASIALAILLVAPSARAQEDAAATVLFKEGMRLMKEGRYAEACPKLEESQRVAPGIGTKFNLADCYEKTGRIARAWGAFLDVAAQTRAKGQTEREQAARDRAAAIEPRLPRLVVSVSAAARVDGLVVKRDGVAVGEATFGVEVPVDPGEHAIEAQAPGRKPWRTTVAMVEGRTREVEIGPLDALPPQEDTRRSDGAAQRTIGLTLGAGGVVALGVGAYFGVRAIQKHDEAASHCNGDACDAAGVSIRQDAVSAGNVSTIAFVAAGALLVGGVVLYLTSPRDERRAATVGVMPGGAMVRVRF